MIEKQYCVAFTKEQIERIQREATAEERTFSAQVRYIVNNYYKMIDVAKENKDTD